MARAEMVKHRGFPGRLPGTDFQFVVRRPNPKGVTRITERQRYGDRRNADRAADEGFLLALWQHFGDAPFPRGNLDAGRISWLFGREVVPAETPFDPESYDSMLRVDPVQAAKSFPGLLDGPI